MEIDLATKQDIDELKQEMLEMEQRIIRAVGQTGKPRRMTLEEVAENWGISKPVASKRLKRMYMDEKIEKVDFDSRPITINRKEFFKAIN